MDQDHSRVTQSERLNLVRVDHAHHASVIKLLTNRRVHHFFPSTPTEEEAHAFFERIQKREREDGLSFWAVIRREDQAFIGLCGLLRQQIEGVDEVEVGYRLFDRYWRQGYGREAAAACLDYAESALKLSSVISLILAENIPSIGVAERNGLCFERVVTFHELPHRLYRIRFRSGE